jgi:hypothetical protein
MNFGQKKVKIFINKIKKNKFVISAIFASGMLFGRQKTLSP